MQMSLRYKEMKEENDYLRSLLDQYVEQQQQQSTHSTHNTQSNLWLKQ